MKKMGLFQENDNHVRQERIAAIRKNEAQVCFIKKTILICLHFRNEDGCILYLK